MSTALPLKPFAMSLFFGKREAVGSGTERKSSVQRSIYGAHKYSGRQLPPFFTFWSDTPPSLFSEYTIFVRCWKPNRILHTIDSGSSWEPSRWLSCVIACVGWFVFLEPCGPAFFFSQQAFVLPMSPDHLREAVTTLEKSLNFNAKKWKSLKILPQLPRILILRF